MIDLPPRPSLHLVAGPNGAGKSSLVADTIGPITGLPFVNADEIAAELWPDDAMLHAKEASQLAQQQRADYIAEGVSFIAETVFSHPSKVELVRDAVAAGYEVTLHVVVVPKELAVARVEDRVEAGGHDVPHDKIRQRYDRLWSLVVEAAGVAAETVLCDNSSDTASHRRFAIVRTNPASVSITGPTPAWLPVELSGLITPP